MVKSRYSLGELATQGGAAPLRSSLGWHVTAPSGNAVKHFFRENWGLTFREKMKNGQIPCAPMLHSALSETFGGVF